LENSTYGDIKKRIGLGLGLFLLWTLIAINHVSADGSPLTIKVVTSSEGSLYANFTIIMGEKEMVLVDAPFTRSDAHRLVAELLETGKELKTIYVTHDHPDHFFSMEVITDAYPDARVISAPEVVKDIWASIPFKIKRWGPMLGRNGPRYPTAPAAHEEKSFKLEGHELQILGPMQGDHHHAMAIFVPTLKALITGDIAFHGIHVWLGETVEEQREDWIEVLDKLIALEPEIVVAGHKLPHLADTPDALTYTREYIAEFNRAAKRSKTSGELIAAIKEKFPDVQDVLNDFILPNSAQVGVGEVPPWKE
jgi:glyoxylase-like metal-dependent hydrolase (beta-lactamase superfamily II)